MKHTVLPENAPTFLEWIKTRGGLAVWESADLSDPTWGCTTPVNGPDGKPVSQPHGKARSQPSRIITSADDVEVCFDREVKRFHVALQRPSGLKIKLTPGSSSRVRREVAKAGEKAHYVFDYSTQECVILAPEKTVPFSQFVP